MKKVLTAVLPVGLIFLAGSSCSSSSNNLVPEGSATAVQAPKPATTAERCEQTTTFTPVEVKDWLGGKIPLEWAQQAAADCFGAGLPAIRIHDDRVNAYLQVVQINARAYTDEHWAMNLNPSDYSQQFYLDVPAQGREKMWPFYNLDYGPKVFANPELDPPTAPRKWKARMYGLALDKTGNCKPIWGVEWGFTQKSASAKAVSARPVAIPPREWKQDYGRIAPFSPNGCL